MKQNKTSVKLWLALCAVLAAGIANAQPPGASVPTPTGTTQIFTNGDLRSNSCYSIVADAIGNNGGDLYVSGWSNGTGTGKIVWRFMDPGTTNLSGSVSPNEGEIAVNGHNIEVGAIYDYNTGDVFIQAAYYRNGIGFILERYQWTGSSFLLQPTYTILLSGSAFLQPNRNINMDTYAGYSWAVVWTEYTAPGVSILQCMLGEGLNATQVITLDGTDGATTPDVALTKNSGMSGGSDAMEVHFVYENKYSDPDVTYGYYSELTESVIPFNVYAINPPNYPPSIEDINNIGSQEMYAFPVIDCPDVTDFTPSADWAYTYTTDRGVEMRYICQGAGIPPTTINMVDGSTYGNTNIAAPYGYYANWQPTIAYNNTGESIYVGWSYNGYPFTTTSRPLVVEVSRDGNSLFSAGDYMMISNNYTATSPQFSKNSFYSTYLYTTFLENANDFMHMHHDWTNNLNFRNQPESSGTATAIKNNQPYIKVEQNPFPHTAGFRVSETLKDAALTTSLIDITGKVIYSGVSSGQQLQAKLQPYLLRLPAGTYILRTENKALQYQQLHKLVKM